MDTADPNFLIKQSMDKSFEAADEDGEEGGETDL